MRDVRLGSTASRELYWTSCPGVIQVKSTPVGGKAAHLIGRVSKPLCTVVTVRMVMTDFTYELTDLMSLGMRSALEVREFRKWSVHQLQ
jgi:hypothetical protein